MFESNDGLEKEEGKNDTTFSIICKIYDILNFDKLIKHIGKFLILTVISISKLINNTPNIISYFQLKKSISNIFISDLERFLL